jgi:hypothetical protein
MPAERIGTAERRGIAQLRFDFVAHKLAATLTDYPIAEPTVFAPSNESVTRHRSRRDAKA